MNLIALPAFTDHCIWMRHDGRQAVVVDPGEFAPVIAALDAQQLVLAAILVTHHHADHRGGGVDALRARARMPVPGPASSKPAQAHDADADEPVAVLTALRQWKNKFR